MKLGARFVAYGLLLCGGAVYAASPYRVGIVMGESMAPTYHNGAPYVMKHLAPEAAIRRGDVVVFRRAGRTYIKRVLGLPGDEFYIMPRSGLIAGDLLVRAGQLDKLRAFAGKARFASQMKVTVRRVLPGTLYVVGDNLEYSEDSRRFGFVDRDSVQGLVQEAPGSPRIEFTDLARRHVHGV